MAKKYENALDHFPLLIYIFFDKKYANLLSESSTVGSAPPCQGGGRQFEPGLSLHHYEVLFLNIIKLINFIQNTKKYLEVF